MNLKFAFGSEGVDFVAANSSTGAWRCRGVNTSLMDKLGQSVARVKVVAMGMNKAYVVIFSDASFYWNLSNTYPGLSRLLQNTKRGDLVVSGTSSRGRDTFNYKLADYCGDCSTSQ